MPISDQHSIEYDFEELQPVIGGVRLDTYISGRAELASDPSYTFYVKSITLDGSVPDMAKRASMYFGRPRKPAKTTLYRRAADDMSAEAHLFRLIEAAIYEDAHAIAAWQAEVEEVA